MADEPTSSPKETERLLEALRGWASVFGELGRRFGSHTGMHSSDASALVHIVNAEERGEPLTQAGLSRRIGLTTGATSSLLNRLESVGHVERRRDQKDRRVVTLRSTPAMHEEVEQFFAAISVDLTALLAQRSAEDLSAFATLLERMTASLEQHLLELTR